MTVSLASARSSIRPFHRKSEPEVLAPLLVAATVDDTIRAKIVGSARDLLADLRKAQTDGWVNAFLQQYRLGTEEGTALLSLAEAFLRVPDPRSMLPGSYAAVCRISGSCRLSCAPFSKTTDRSIRRQRHNAAICQH